MKERLSQYKHCLLLLYFPIYITAFYFLETVTPDKIHIINCELDQYIPFVEYFIIPYFLWFAYIAVTGFYFMVFEKESFVKFMFFAMMGMTIFVIVSYIYPNGLDIRPTTFARDNIFVDMTRFLYSIDTPTNVLPSIHVFNSVAACIAIRKSPKLKDKKVVQIISGVLTASIVLATMFLKQHSIFDVLSALALSCLAYYLVYNEGIVRMRNAAEASGYKKKAKKVKA